MSKSITITIPDDFYKILQKRKDQEGVTIKFQINEIFENYMEVQNANK